MVQKANEHTLMTKEQIREYIGEHFPLFNSGADVDVREIGDGNINYVFRVINTNQQESLVVKQADKLLRSSGRPLDINRNKIEAEVLNIQYKLVPEYVPEVLLYDEKMAVMVMEDISIYENLRYALLAKKVFPKLAQQISQFLVQTLGNTNDVVMDKRQKKAYVKQFINSDMCDISEDLVFTEPYNDYKKRNVITCGNEEFVQSHLYDNHELIAEVAKLREQFMNHAQALIHGDLHSGSIFVTQEGMKVIDPEFAFYGPMGYDIGNVLAHLFLSLVGNGSNEEDDKFDMWVLETISFIFDHVSSGLKQLIFDQTRVSLYKTEEFINYYVDQVMVDAIGYTGTEIIRRVVGDSKVKELVDIKQGPQKVKIEQKIIQLATELIMNRQQITKGNQLIKIYKDIYS